MTGPFPEMLAKALPPTRSNELLSRLMATMKQIYGFSRADFMNQQQIGDFKKATINLFNDFQVTNYCILQLSIFLKIRNYSNIMRH
jgi:hypothetical protein